MRPTFYSVKSAEEEDIGWHQDGFDFSYEPSIYAKETNDLNPKF
jgi:hypothetical protein